MTLLFIAIIGLAFMGIATTIYVERKHADMSWDDIFYLGRHDSSEVFANDQKAEADINEDRAPAVVDPKMLAELPVTNKGVIQAAFVGVRRKRRGRKKEKIAPLNVQGTRAISAGRHRVQEHPISMSEQVTLAHVSGVESLGTSVIDIEGIGPKYVDKLRKVGVKRTHHFLERGASKKDRKELAAEAGLDESQLLKWTNMADLMRIRGVGEEYSDLLEAAGVNTVKELRNRKPGNLHHAMVEVNLKKKLVRHVPGHAQVERWVELARTLKPVITY